MKRSSFFLKKERELCKNIRCTDTRVETGAPPPTPPRSGFSPPTAATPLAGTARAA